MTELRIHYHDICAKHQVGPEHPESPCRYRVVKEALDITQFSSHISWHEAPNVENNIITLAHPQSYIDELTAASPTSGFFRLDEDTSMNAHSIESTRLAVGAAIDAVNHTHQTDIPGFCLTRPPGHHAEQTTAMGFCLFNQVAITAKYLTQILGYRRVAIIDFDVHHGNGTEDIVKDSKEIRLYSTFQHPLYPFCGVPSSSSNVFNIPLDTGLRSADFRLIFDQEVISSLEKWKPDFLLISAGFDAHKADPLAQLNLQTDDYAWLGHQVSRLANRFCPGRIVASMEGGYHLEALADSASAFVDSMRRQ
ncbi:MAG: histone deacetylase family protein [Pseudomonadota bacterium]